MNDQAKPDAIGALCLSCGLCCSGAIFDYLALEPDETGLLEVGMRPYPAITNTAALPCPCLSDRACGIYALRPKACRAYFCKVIAGFRSNDLSAEQAGQIIAETRGLVERITALLSSGETLADARTAWRTNPAGWQLGDPAGLAARGQRHLLLTALNRQLDTHFRFADQQQTHFKLDEPQA